LLNKKLQVKYWIRWCCLYRSLIISNKWIIPKEIRMVHLKSNKLRTSRHLASVCKNWNKNKNSYLLGLFLRQIIGISCWKKSRCCITSFFFWIQGNPLPGKYTLWVQVSELNPGCPRLLLEVHALTRRKDLLCRFQALCHHATRPLRTRLHNINT